MSDDLIKRSDAIASLGEEPYVWADDDEFAQGERSQWIDDVSAIKAVPSADRPQEWIPCSERLPKDRGHYICSFVQPQRIDKIHIGLAYCENGRWVGYNASEITAWMPLPKPWKGAEE